jgi:hypothetical protein
MFALVGTDANINDILKNYFLKEYKPLIVQHYCNYKWKILGLPTPGYRVPEYNGVFPSEFVIRESLIKKLKPLITIFERLGYVNEEKSKQINHMFSNFIEVEDWNKKMDVMFD